MNLVLTPIKPAVSINANEPFHVLLRVQAPQLSESKPIPLNLAVVVDRSGSMQGESIAEAKRCVHYLVEHLSSADQVALVVYDDKVDTLLDVIPAQQAQSKITQCLADIQIGGTTDLHAGWLQGADLLAPITSEHAICRVILLSDGKANEGLTDVRDIAQQVLHLAQAGVTTTTVGLGRGFNEFLMTAMANAGQGVAHYGEQAEDLFETFESELGLLKNLAWRDVGFTVTGPNGVEVVNPYSIRNDEWHLPAIAVGAEAWALLRIPASDVGKLADESAALTVQLRATDQNGQSHEFTQILNPLKFVSADEFEALEKDELVGRRVDDLRAAEIQFNARDAAREGNWRAVEQLLSELEVISRNNPWLAASLVHLQKMLFERDGESMSKELHYKAYSMSQRISSINEPSFDTLSEAIVAPHLRRKVSQGKRTQP